MSKIFKVVDRDTGEEVKLTDGFFVVYDSGYAAVVRGDGDFYTSITPVNKHKYKVVFNKNWFERKIALQG